MLKNRPTKTLIFPTSGTFGKDSVVFRTTKQRMEAPVQEAEPIDREHHRKAYFEKQFMEEMLKAKNMRMVKK